MKLLAKSIFLTASFLITTSCFATNVANTTPAPTAVKAPAAELFSAHQQEAIEKIIHNYLLTHPEVLIEVSHALEMKQQSMMQAKAQKMIPFVISDLLHAQNSPVAGNPQSTVSVVEFYDNQCPHCKVMGKEIDALLASNPNIRIVYKELPIFGPDSEFAAKAALAAQRQGKFTVFHNALLNAPGRLNNQIVLDIAKSVGIDVNTLQANMNLPEYTEELKANAALASKLGINGTPAFVIVHPTKDGKVKSVFIPGQTNKNQLLQAVQSV